MFDILDLHKLNILHKLTLRILSDCTIEIENATAIYILIKKK